jgi:hypothetical protein
VDNLALSQSNEQFTSAVHPFYIEGPAYLFALEHCLANAFGIPNDHIEDTRRDASSDCQLCDCRSG